MRPLKVESPNKRVKKVRDGAEHVVGEVVVSAESLSIDKEFGTYRKSGCSSAPEVKVWMMERDVRGKYE